MRVSLPKVFANTKNLGIRLRVWTVCLGDQDTQITWEDTHLSGTGLNYGFHGSVGFFLEAYGTIWRVFYSEPLC